MNQAIVNDNKTAVGGAMELPSNVGMGGMDDVGGAAGGQDSPPSIDHNINQAIVNDNKTAVGSVSGVEGDCASPYWKWASTYPRRPLLIF